MEGEGGVSTNPGALLWRSGVDGSAIPGLEAQRNTGLRGGVRRFSVEGLVGAK